MNFPYESCLLDPDVTKQLLTFFKGTPKEFVLLGPKKYLLNKLFEEEASKIYNMQVRSDDIWIVTLPRSGTTLTQEIIWEVAHDMDFKKVNNEVIYDKFPSLTVSPLIDPEEVEKRVAEYPQYEEQIRSIKYHIVDILAEATTQRFIKSHLPLSLTPPGLLNVAKVVYVARDPRDVAVSYYHACKFFKFMQYEGDFKTFWKFFISGHIIFTPYFEHVKEAWNERDNPNMLFMFYEDIVQDKPSAIRRIASFLNKHPTDEQVTELTGRLHIDKFRKDPTVNFEHMREVGWMNEGEVFIRKGKVGGWRDYFDEEMTQQADDWIKENLKDTDLRFPVM